MDTKAGNKLDIPISRLITLLFYLCFGVLLQGATYSHIAAFFYEYATNIKEMTSSQYGLVMGSYCFVIFFVTPMTAKVVTAKKFQDRHLLIIGWMIDGVFCVLLSVLSIVSPGAHFFALSLVLRILEAIGCAVGFFMTYVSAGAELGKINHIIIPVLETVYGVSVVIGPAVSGFLYDQGGFILPFLTIGSVLIVLAISALCIFPKPQTFEASEVSSDETPAKPLTLSSAYKFTIIVNVLMAMNAFIVISFNEATLAIVLKSYGLTTSQTGVMFLFSGGLYAVSSLFLGYISKFMADPRLLVFLGNLVVIISLFFMGPIIESFDRPLWVIYIAQSLLGLGAGPAFVCSYLQSIRELGGSKEAYAVLSAIFTPMTSIGCTIGPLVAGFILEYYSYRTVVIINAIQTAVLSIVLLLTLLKFKSPRADAEEMKHVNGKSDVPTYGGA